MWFRRSILTGLSVAAAASCAGCGSISSDVSAEHANTEFEPQALHTVQGFGELSVTAGQSTFQRMDVFESASNDEDPETVAMSLEADGVDMNVLDVWSSRLTPGDGLRQLDPDLRVMFRLAPIGEDACASDWKVGPFDLRRGAADASSSYLREFPSDARDWVLSGQYSLCAEIRADFDGVVKLGAAGVFAKKKTDHPDAEGESHGGQGDHGSPSDDGSSSDDVEGGHKGEFPVLGVLICHVPPGNPDKRRTLAVAPQAVDAHLAHGDTLGACGHQDDDDPDDEVPVVLTADAGPDVTVIAGEPVTRIGSGGVQTGVLSSSVVDYSWEQSAGPAAPSTADGPTLTVDTSAVEGQLVFRLTVSTSEGQVSAFDDFVLTVMPVRIEQVMSARWHHAVRRNNRSADLWGWNRYGQMGDGSDLANVVSMDAGQTHTLYARTDGTVWTLGQNKWATTSIPVQVTGVDQVVQVTALSAGGIMLRNDGAVWGFGDDRNAQCALAGQPLPGDGGVLGPIPIPGLPGNITAISSGAQHTIALDVDGNAWVWGSRFGCTPWVALTNVVSVSAGETDLCLFVHADGSAWAMGFNLHGQLGNGTTVSNYTTPTQVIGLSNVVGVSAGDRHSMFQLADGSLWAAGWNHDCRLGLEDEINPVTRQFGSVVATPAQVPLANVTAIAGGFAHGVAVTADDVIWVWGLNSAQQLSDGTNETLPSTICTPVPVSLVEP